MLLNLQPPALTSDPNDHAKPGDLNTDNQKPDRDIKQHQPAASNRPSPAAKASANVTAKSEICERESVIIGGPFFVWGQRFGNDYGNETALIAGKHGRTGENNQGFTVQPPFW
jgi:hypothetical protein